jgi:hypothetical protein
VKEFARKTSKPDPRITPAFAWREWTKQRKPEVRIADISVNKRHRYLPDIRTKQGWPLRGVWEHFSRQLKHVCLLFVFLALQPIVVVFSTAQ